MGEFGGLLFMGLYRVGYDWSDLVVVEKVKELEINLIIFVGL